MCVNVFYLDFKLGYYLTWIYCAVMLMYDQSLNKKFEYYSTVYKYLYYNKLSIIILIFKQVCYIYKYFIKLIFYL
jgi:hypothetical protein